MNGATLRRGRFQGLHQILRFNRRFYRRVVAGASVALLIGAHVQPVYRAILLAGCLPALFWTCSSVLVSYYVYDWFPLYDLTWLARILAKAPRRWSNIHAGFDETSHLLSALFPSAEGHVLDIYDPGEMTEISIKVAKRMIPSGAKTRAANWSCLPIDSGTLDAVLLMFAAHELRRDEARLQLFREVARVLQKDGEVALVEHTRDWANFLAFGPGFLHFFSRRDWRQVARAAGLQVRTEFSITRFVRVFMLRKAA